MDMNYPIHTAAQAPEKARPLLAGAEKAFGFVPNMLGKMATAPALLEGYMTLARIFDTSSLSPAERQIVLLSTSYENGCDYCMAAHTVIASMQQVDKAVVEATRSGSPIADAKLEALRRFAAAVTATRGWPDPLVTKAFFAAGYGQQQALEVILGVGLKTLSNYTNHLAATPIDPAFTAARWSRPA